MGRSEFVVRGCAYRGERGQEPNLLAKSELQHAEGKGLVFGRKRLVLAKGEGFTVLYFILEEKTISQEERNFLRKKENDRFLKD